MNLTNEMGLPETFFRAVLNDKYDRGDADYSITDLVNPPQITILRRRYAEQITEDVSERIWSLLGSSVHAMLERAEHDNAIAEERLFAEVRGVRISGAPDLYEEPATITDYKVTSAWTVIYGDRIKEWEQQVNGYAWLYAQAGFPVERLRVVALFRDWSKSKAKADPSRYPQSQVRVVPLRLWSAQEQRDWIESRVSVLNEAAAMPDAALPGCSPDEMWEKPAKYAAMKTGRKRAIRLFDSLADAERELPALKGDHIVTRPGEHTRCEDYCAVAPFCHQYRAYRAGQEME